MDNQLPITHDGLASITVRLADGANLLFIVMRLAVPTTVTVIIVVRVRSVCGDVCSIPLAIMTVFR